MEKKIITFFSGNRAEFGILFPLIKELNGYYVLNIVLSGAHVLSTWNSSSDSVKQLKDNNIDYNLYEINLDESHDFYLNSLSRIYDWMTDFYKTHHSDFSVVLGDRIESYGFALASFYSQVPLIHLCGGDVVNVSNFDTNVRHSISKIANYHMVSNISSRNTLAQMGEENDRIIVIGNPSFDYDRMGMLSKKSEIMTSYNIKDNDYIGVLTYHPDMKKTSEANLIDFKIILKGVLNSTLDKIIITYPNNDIGHEDILNYLENEIKESERVRIVKSLGTFKYLSLMKNFNTIVIGNSSSGLLETPFYCVPVLNIGNRQDGRIRGCNVFDVEIDADNISKNIKILINQYNEYKLKFAENKEIFGDGNAAIKARKFIKDLSHKDKYDMLFKKFVIREVV